MSATLEGSAPPVIATPVIIDWQLSSYFAWGIMGVQHVLNWSLQQPEPMLTTIAVKEELIDLDPLEWARIRPALDAARDLQSWLQPLRGQDVRFNAPVLHALGNGLLGMNSIPGAVRLAGQPDIALATFENTDFGRADRERAHAYALIVVPSAWARTQLEAAGIGPVALVHEGIDPTRFHPGPRADLFAGRFTVFSGGKLEFRKGQDLVVRAFAIFAARHPDALLVTAWHSPFPGAAQSLNAESALEPIELLDGGPSLDVIGWAVRNGIPASQFLSIGQVPNGKMPRIYREMDIAVFPNRCEGATNLVAMECMACGVPVILAQNTGQADITAGDRCYVLARQTAVPGPGRDGWGESDVEEIVAALEDAYADPAGRRARAERGAAFMRERSWARTVRARARAIAASL